jgi:RNA ligase
MNATLTFAPTVTLGDLLDIDAVNAAIGANLVRPRLSDDGTLVVLNYTEVCAFSKAWSPVTLAARGLIVTANYTADGTLSADALVVARPFAKFFNHGEVAHDPVALAAMTGPVVVADKLDGSLGILFFDPAANDWRVSTRGSADSEMAVHGTALIRAYIADGSFNPTPGFTYLAEIVYPENRIVLNYNGLDALILLGKVDLLSGVSTPINLIPVSEWAGLRAEVFPFATLAEAALSVELSPRANAEGVIVHFVNSDFRVKLKQADYLALHSSRFNLTERSVWEAISTGSYDRLLADSEEEFRPWIENVQTRIISDAAALVSDAYRLFALMGDSTDRKSFALAVNGAVSDGVMSADMSGFLFGIAGGRTLAASDSKVLKRFYPSHVPFAAGF